MGYSKFERQTWHDEKFRRWTRDVRDMWKYLMTSPHMEGTGGRIGAYVLHPMYAAADLSAADDQWTPDRVQDALARLHELGRIVWDRDTDLVLLVNFFRHNQPANPKQVDAAVSAVQEIPASRPVLERLRQSLGEQLPQAFKSGTPLRGRILEAVDDRLSKLPSGKDLNGSETVTPTVTETVTPTVGGTSEQNRAEQSRTEPTTTSDESLGADAPQSDNLGDVLAPLIREHMWLGKDPPPKTLEREPKWNMGREINVAEQLVDGGDVTAPDLARIIETHRDALDVDPGVPTSLLWFNRKDRRDLLNICRGYLDKHADQASAVGDVLRKLQVSP